MNYTVVWLPAAERELAELWVNSLRQAEVTMAANALDLRLSEDGPEEGESRSGDLRIAIERPLGIIFKFVEESQIVQVGSVWEFR